VDFLISHITIAMYRNN